MWPVRELVPHREPMILIDRVQDAGEDFVVAEVRIKAGIPFFEAEVGVPAWVGIEYMGQSIAALAGVRAKRAERPIRSGFLAGCRRYVCSVPAFKPGSQLTIEVREVSGGDPLSTFAAVIRDDGVLAEAAISVYLQPEAEP
ncbi:hotdog family protein [soil metagenome]